MNARRTPPWIALAGVALLVAGCATPEPWAQIQGQAAASFARTEVVRVEGRFLLALPKGFDAKAGTRWPLLIFLHGSGEAGTDLDKVTVHGPPRLMKEGQSLPFIVASPQSTYQFPYGGFDPVELDAMLDELLARLPVDPDRVYLTGLSLGGMWSYGWASLRPGRFAAIVPISGAWNPEDACRLKSVPVRAFHGAKDDVVPVAHEQAMVEAIRACGGDATLTVYPDAGHDAWTRTYADPALYAWLLTQRRHAAPAR
jgi:predicted peptidase